MKLRECLEPSGAAVLMDKLRFRMACRLRLVEHLCPEHAAYLRFKEIHRQQSFSQLGQDLFVLHSLAGKRAGYFVDFGASDGVSLSNTYLLEQSFGWNGICAEPARQWHRALRANRVCRIDERCVWSKSGESLRFLECEEGEYSTLRSLVENDGHVARRRLAREYDVLTVTLTDLLASHHAPRDIDYLSIDTEGSELDVLAAHDFDRYRFRIITVEHNGQAARRNKIAKLLSAQGYRRCIPALSLWDDWYVLKSLSTAVREREHSIQ